MITLSCPAEPRALKRLHHARQPCSAVIVIFPTRFLSEHHARNLRRGSTRARRSIHIRREAAAVHSCGCSETSKVCDSGQQFSAVSHYITKHHSRLLRRGKVDIELLPGAAARVFCPYVTLRDFFLFISYPFSIAHRYMVAL